MRLQRQWWSGLVAAVLGGLVGVTAVAAGEQFLPVLSAREGAVRSVYTPVTNGYIAYLTLLNARDGGINGVKLLWEECETVYDVTRGVECYEHLKSKGPTGAAVVSPSGTPLTYALLERELPSLASELAVCEGKRWAKGRSGTHVAGGKVQDKGLSNDLVYHDVVL